LIAYALYRNCIGSASTGRCDLLLLVPLFEKLKVKRGEKGGFVQIRQIIDCLTLRCLGSSQYYSDLRILVLKYLEPQLQKCFLIG